MTKPTQEQVIAWARNTGCLNIGDYGHKTYEFETEELKRFAALAYEAGRKDENEACAEIVGTHRIPVGNSAAGEMACEWTYNALQEVYDAIRARREQ